MAQNMAVVRASLGAVHVRFLGGVPDGSDGFTLTPEAARELAAQLVGAAEDATEPPRGRPPFGACSVNPVWRGQ